MITDKYIATALARAELAESVELPATQWSQLLRELSLLHKLAVDVQDLLNCPNGMLRAEGECGDRLGKLMTDAAHVIHTMTYDEA